MKRRCFTKYVVSKAINEVLTTPVIMEITENFMILCFIRPLIPTFEFETFFVAGKFVKIAQKVTFVCAKCGKTVPISNKTNFICHVCAKKLQNEI